MAVLEPASHSHYSVTSNDKISRDRDIHKSRIQGCLEDGLVGIRGGARTPYQMKESKHRFATTAFFLRPGQLMGSSGSPSLNLSMVGAVGMHASGSSACIPIALESTEKNTGSAYGA